LCSLYPQKDGALIVSTDTTQILSTDGRCAPCICRKTVHSLYPQTPHRLYSQTDIVLLVSTERRCTDCIHRHRTNCIHRRTLCSLYPQKDGALIVSTDTAQIVPTDGRCYSCIHRQTVLYPFRAFAAPATTSPSPYLPVISACSNAADGERINKTKLCAWSFVRQ